MEKPIKEWYNELPEPYRSQAIENENPNYEDYPINGTATCQGEAVIRGFSWGSSKQGSDYWDEFHDTL